jgi:hypothetical protein
MLDPNTNVWMDVGMTDVADVPSQGAAPEALVNVLSRIIEAVPDISLSKLSSVSQGLQSGASNMMGPLEKSLDLLEVLKSVVDVPLSERTTFGRIGKNVPVWLQGVLDAPAVIARNVVRTKLDLAKTNLLTLLEARPPTRWEAMRLMDRDYLERTLDEAKVRSTKLKASEPMSSGSMTSVQEFDTRALREVNERASRIGMMKRESSGVLGDVELNIRNTGEALQMLSPLALLLIPAVRGAVSAITLRDAIRDSKPDPVQPREPTNSPPSPEVAPGNYSGAEGAYMIANRQRVDAEVEEEKARVRALDDVRAKASDDQMSLLRGLLLGVSQGVGRGLGSEAIRVMFQPSTSGGATSGGGADLRRLRTPVEGKKGRKKRMRRSSQAGSPTQNTAIRRKNV